MALQTQNLVMVGLGILKDTPPNPVQPPLKDGIHLRWAFRRQLGFPWHGFYLFRRLHRDAPPICLSNAIGALQKGPLPSNQLNTPRGGISSDRALFLTNDFPASNIVEFDLAGRKSLRFTLPPGEAAYQVELRIGFRDKAEIEVMALSGTTPVARALVTGKSGDVVVVTLAFDAITSVKIGTGPAALIDLCYAPVSRDATRGWEAVPNFPYPLCLPVTHRDYPCSGNAPVNRAAAEALALGRVIYGPPVAWAGAPFSGLHEQLIKLVVGGPASIPMADRSTPVAGVPVPPDSGLTAPRMLRQHPLDLVLFGTLHPAIAQMVGLYWADQKVEPGVPFDYLILSDYTGVLGGKPNDALKFLATFGFANMDGYIVFNKRMASAPALAAPKDLRAYALPGAIVRTQDGGTQDASNNAGLRWDRGVFKLGTEVLLPDRALMYHLWRADLGDAEQPAAPSPSAYKLLTEKRPILVAEPRLPPGKSPQRSLDWPPFPLHAIDGKLREGWYSYRVSGIDIFGRHSPNSSSGQWFEWAPTPKPPPWYYQDPAGDREIHPFAVRLLDKIPPPPPTAIEAYALDPADPTVVRDVAYNNWRVTLSPAERDTVIGLRVQWIWTEAHMRQAPDTREFRIYFHPGTDLPVPDHSLSADWQERYYVVGFDEHVMVTTDATGRPLRKYEVFLPADNDDFRDGLPLLPSPAEPITYAHIGVSAADDKTHTLDDPKWASGRWGGRFGNEGRIGAPAKIFRVLRTPPAPPVSTPDAERIFATAADYHSHSFYTYRWRPVAHLKTHIFRALDDTLFKVDWSRRPRSPLSAVQRQFFPDPAAEPRWNITKRQQVANELNTLNGLSHDEAGTAQAMTRYQALSNDGLRVLAGLTGNERAFTQLTIQPLDPDVPANADRIGPDNPPDFAVDPALRAYIDTLDGRSTNRYFYRAAYVDGAHNRSALGLSSAPVYLPDVVPPRAPVITKVLGGDRQITLRWASNREPDLREYHVYRADSPEAARDLRLMPLVHTETVPTGDPRVRPAEVEWTDKSIPTLIPVHYRLVAVDEAGNASTPASSVVAQAFDDSRPMPPAWGTPTNVGEGLELRWTPADPSYHPLVQRRDPFVYPPRWDNITSWLLAATDHVVDTTRESGQTYLYRIRVQDEHGRVNRDFNELEA